MPRIRARAAWPRRPESRSPPCNGSGAHLACNRIGSRRSSFRPIPTSSLKCAMSSGFTWRQGRAISTLRSSVVLDQEYQVDCVARRRLCTGIIVPLQMATVSECRYRWLRVSATKPGVGRFFAFPEPGLTFAHMFPLCSHHENSVKRLR
jgi:hypothetical protein